MVDPLPRERIGFAAIWAQVRRENDRGTLLLLGSAACLPVVYVYQGQPSFFLRHLSDPGLPLAQVFAQLWRFSSLFTLFFLVPALLWRLVLGRPLSALGLRLGAVGPGLAFGLGGLVVAAPLLWLASAMPDLQAEYPMAREAFRSPGLMVAYLAAYGLYYWGWEFFFRGALQLGLSSALGFTGALMVQLLPSVLLHIGKPVGETWGAVIVAPLFGAAALRCGSFLPIFLFHYGIGILNDIFCALRLGLL